MYYMPSTKEKFNTHSEIRSALANVLFPPAIDNEMLAYIGVFPLVYMQPSVAYDKVAEPTNIEQVEGIWTQLWNVRNATPEERDAKERASRPEVPQLVSQRQARQALLLTGLLDSVPAAITALDDGTPEGKQKMRLAQIEWEDSQTFERHRPLVIEIASAIGLDDAGLDALFIEAARL